MGSCVEDWGEKKKLMKDYDRRVNEKLKTSLGIQNCLERNVKVIVQFNESVQGLQNFGGDNGSLNRLLAQNHQVSNSEN